jgi:hypothetical protein
LTSERDELELAAANLTSVSNVFGYEHRNWLFFWYCDNFHNEKIYKIDDLGCYILFEVKDDELIVLDIVAEKIPKLAAVLPFLLNTSEQAVRKVRFMFCPDKLTDQYYAIDNTEDLFYSCDQFRLPDRVFCIPETLRG